MYAETGLLFPYPHNSFPRGPHREESNASLSNPVETSSVSDYDLGGEGDLFKAPEPVVEEPLMDLDPMTFAISLISCGEDVVPSQAFNVAKSIENEQLLSEVFYECQKDLLAKVITDAPVLEILDNRISCASSDGGQMVREKMLFEGQIQKSVSSGCLGSMEWNDGAAMRQKFLDFTSMDFGSLYGLRRAFSEGDIKTLCNDHLSLVQSPLAWPGCNSEQRREKLSRYWDKKKKRNFGRRIKYACRKALADSQPRIRGRFAKTEEPEILKKL